MPQQKKRLRDACIDEKMYKSDLELLKLYQDTCSKIMAFATSGMGALGLSIAANIFEYPEKEKLLQHEIANLAAACGTFFLVSIGFGLLHKFWSSESMFYQMRSLRYTANGQLISAENDHNWRVKLLKLSSYVLGCAGLAFFLGGICFAGCFYARLSNSTNFLPLLQTATTSIAIVSGLVWSIQFLASGAIKQTTFSSGKQIRRMKSNFLKEFSLTKPPQ